MESLLVHVFVALVSNQMIAIESVGRNDVFSTNTMLQWLNWTGEHKWNYMSNYINYGISTTSCRGIHVNMVVREAAHFPERQKMAEMKALHEKIVTAKDPLKFSELDIWRIPPLEVADELVQKGRDEVYELGSRIGHGFNGLFSRFAQTNEFSKFVSSSDRKAINSSNIFYRGLKYQIDKIPTFKNEINDSLMRFSEGCVKHKRQQQVSSDNLKEYYEFLKTTTFTDIMVSVRRKLGLQANLTEADIFMIYDWCAYGMYISDDTTWCNLLSDDDRLVLEYAQDLLNYYKYSYGNPMNAKMSCSHVRDIFNTMDSAINRSLNYFNDQELSEASYLAGKFQFGHVDTIIPLMTALGMFRDKEPLLSANMAVMKDRKFKTSRISPYTGSVAFILNACDNARRIALNSMGYEKFSPGQQTIRIQAFVNEVRVPFCENSYYCLYDEVKRNFQHFIDSCNMTEICGAKSPVTTQALMQTTTLSSGMYTLVVYSSTILMFLLIHLL